MKEVFTRLIVAMLLIGSTQCGVNDDSDIPYKKNSLIVFAGGTNISNMQYHGFLEAIIQASMPEKKLRIRNLAWDGDTVFEQYRDLNFGSWQENIDSLEADLVFVQFGQMEALQGKVSIDSFELAYRRLLEQIRKEGRKLVLISPTPFEPESMEQMVSYGLENPLDNAILEKYAASVQRLAAENGYLYIDLFNLLKKDAASVSSPETHPEGGSHSSPANESGSSNADQSHSNGGSVHPKEDHSHSASLTSNGIHLTEDGHKQVAALIAAATGLGRAYSSEMEPLRKQIIAKNEIWFNYWRPGNWSFLKGDRTHVEFSRDWRDAEKRIFPEEMKAFQPILESAEKQVHQLAADVD